MKVKLTRDLYDPKQSKYLKENSIIDIEDEDGIPTNAFWRGIVKDNEITKIFIIEPKNKK